jgi:hypothetical protein
MQISDYSGSKLFATHNPLSDLPETAQKGNDLAQVILSNTSNYALPVPANLNPALGLPHLSSFPPPLNRLLDSYFLTTNKEQQATDLLKLLPTLESLPPLHSSQELVFTELLATLFRQDEGSEIWGLVEKGDLTVQAITIAALLKAYSVDPSKISFYLTKLQTAPEAAWWKAATLGPYDVAIAKVMVAYVPSASLHAFLKGLSTSFSTPQQEKVAIITYLSDATPINLSF